MRRDKIDGEDETVASDTPNYERTASQRLQEQEYHVERESKPLYSIYHS